MKSIVLCADDYGQSEAISAGILSLIKNERISATSCMVTTPDWARAAKQLKPVEAKVDVGLHFNLTQGKALSSEWQKKYGANFQGVGTLMFRALTGRLDKATVKAEWHAQMAAFQRAMNRLPDFVDGHQHIHQFPIIRDVLIENYSDQMRAQGVYYRWIGVHPELLDLVGFFKKWVIYVMGTRPFGALMRANAIPHNTSFVGIYPFHRSSEYRSYCKRFFDEVETGGLMMCHPGSQSGDHQDAIEYARIEEAAYLSSNDFCSDIEQAGVQIKRFKQC